jgi:serine/threonine protein kinase/Tol biopolymer transport system component
MDAKTWAAVKSLLADVAGLPASERERSIREQCHDPALRDELLQLAADPAALSDIFLRLALAPGTRVGVYVIDSLLGRGGMGEVYRARDTKLGRDVALKVLPSAFAADPERLARLEREARLLASLNHPNIAQIHGLEETAGLYALVMELVEGDTLAERIARGPIPIQEALPIARQMCEALEAAHDHGIIHRDLKPANVKRRPDGIVKVLDFGLAKILDPDPSLAPVGGSAAPTTTPPAMTALGVILGTAAYMAPEQARGMLVDKRADIWAFGCVLYEMLTGRQAFSGSDVLGTLASVLTTEPNWGAVPSKTPPNIHRLLHRCLEKDPRRRLQAIGDARVEIEDTAGAAETSGGRGSTWREGPSWSIVAVVGLAVLGAALYLTTRPRSMASDGVTRFEITMPPGVYFNGSASLSPDGRRVAFVGAYAAGRQLYVRELNQLEASPLPSTATNVMSCFFSPDGRDLGFYSFERVLKRVTLSTGVATPPLAREVDGTGSWGRDNQLTFIRANELWQVPVTGGNPKQLTRLDPKTGEIAHLWPMAIGDGQNILFEVQKQRRESHIEAVSATTDARHLVEESGSRPIYASNGYLLFIQGTDLLTASFDANRVKTTAPAVRVLQNVAQVFSVSSTGALLYAEPRLRRLVWVSRDGTEEPIAWAAHDYWLPALSPNGQHVAFSREDVGGVWDQDLVRGPLTPLRDDGNFHIWTPDGTHIVVTTPSGMKVVDPHGGEPAQPVPGSSAGDNVSDVTSDGIVAYVRLSPDTQADIYLRSLDGRAPVRALARTPAYEGAPQISPDQRWIAYVSDESGASEIYVRPFPGFGRKWPISTHGGAEPRWSRNGQELFYRNDDQMMSVHRSNDPENPFSQPVKLWEHKYLNGRAQPMYDVAKDGRFLMIRDEPGSRRLIVVENWIEELKTRIAAGK